MIEHIKFHPEYSNSHSKWKTIDDFIDGSNDRVLRYLQQWASEASNTPDAVKAFQRRQRRVCNENEVYPILEVLIGYLGQPISFGRFSSTEAQDSNLAIILEDVTGFEMSAQAAFKEALRLYLRHGRAGILVEGPAELSKSAGGARLTNERSYQCIYTALEIKDWSYFRTGPKRGQLSSVLLADGNVTTEAGTFAKYLRYSYKPANLEKYVVESLISKSPHVADNCRDEIEVEVTPVSIGYLDRIPFVLIGKGLDECQLKIPVAYNEKLLNLRSEHDNIDYFQSSKRTILTGCTGDDIETMNEQTVTCIPNQEASVHSIDPGDPKSLSERIQRMEVKLRRFGLKQYNQIVSENSAQVQSADSKELDMKGLKVWLNELLDMFQKKLRQVYALHAQFEGVKEQVEVTISRDFGLDDKVGIEQERGSLFSRSGSLGAREVQKQVVLQQISEMRNIVPEQDEDVEAARERLMDDVRNAQPEPPSIGALGFKSNSNRSPLDNVV